jgi:hypothetical protein
MLLMFLTKLIDSILHTVRHIFMIRNKTFLAALFYMLATFCSLMSIHYLIMNPTMGTIILLCAAAFIGTYLPSLFMKHEVA